MTDRRKKQKQRRREEAELVIDVLIEKVSEIAITVEAAGTWARARPFLEEEYPDDEVDELRQLVPVSRGGPNDSPLMEELWQDVVREHLNTPEGREWFLTVQEELADEGR